MTDFPVNIWTDEVRPFLLRSKKRDEDYRRQMRDFVSAFRGKTLPLNNPADARWMVCDLHDTIYSEREDVVKGWETFYLPDEVRMQVIGVVKGTSCPCDQLVLMTCEDRKLYVFDGEELHVVAGSLELLCAEGMEYPAPLSYYKGEAFKDMNDEDWDKLQQGAVGKSLDTAHDELVARHKPEFLRNLFRVSPEEDLWARMEMFPAVSHGSTPESPSRPLSTGKKKTQKEGSQDASSLDALTSLPPFHVLLDDDDDNDDDGFVSLLSSGFSPWVS
uniref:uncharacterized protein n=1 Tax=Semicossyphus pulcher TaxID=241346 RepID=UPI0037E9940E